MANLYGYNTSTARKLSEFDGMYGQNLQKELQREIRKEKPAKASKTKSARANIILVALCFAMAFSVVKGYVSINEANNEISDLVSEYNNIVASNQALQVKIDKAIDLNKLQTVAGERFGMIKPERYQMFYVDLEMEDFSEDTRSSETIKKQESFASMGAPGIITGALNLLQ